MSKIKVGIVGAIVLAVAATGVVELRANRALRAEFGALRGEGDDSGRLQKENDQLGSALRKLGEKNPEADEVVRLQRRAAVLQARPPGVVDAEMKPAAAWRNVGRATPEAANETFHWAMFSGNLSLLASFVVFDDDTPTNREAFMAHFSEAVRARYRTPEQIAAAPFLTTTLKNENSPADAFEVIAVDDHVGGNGSRFGQKRVRIWYRLASGSEFEGGGRWQSTRDGWAPAAFSLTKDWEGIVSLIDPVTGNPLAKKPR